MYGLMIRPSTCTIICKCTLSYHNTRSRGRRVCGDCSEVTLFHSPTTTTGLRCCEASIGSLPYSRRGLLTTTITLSSSIALQAPIQCRRPPLMSISSSGLPSIAPTTSRRSPSDKRNWLPARGFDLPGRPGAKPTVPGEVQRMPAMRFWVKKSYLCTYLLTVDEA